MAESELIPLVDAVRSCDLCATHLPHGANPVIQIDPQARILIASQAPGRKVHETGVPFNDASGERLRDWMGVTRATFYDACRIAILPMGFCYPGTGKSGDLAPRPECAVHWRQALLEQLTEVRLTLVIGQYALAYHLPQRPATLTDTVRAWRDYFPAVLPLPHPSPRNNIWLRRNAWFEEEVVPSLRQRVQQVLEA
jgi:uracil-DNA glycosylase